MLSLKLQECFGRQSSLNGCHFHLSQAWWRKIQSLGLATEYKSEVSVIEKWLKVFFGLSFLNSENIEECFAFDLFSCTPDDPRAVRFADYIVHNYIEATILLQFGWNPA